MNNNYFPVFLQVIIVLILGLVLLLVFPELKKNTWSIALTFVILFLLISNYFLTAEMLEKPLKCNNRSNFTNVNNNSKLNNNLSVNNLSSYNQNLNRIENYRKQLDKLSKQELEKLNGPQLNKILDSLEMNLKSNKYDILNQSKNKFVNDKDVPGIYVNNDVFPDSVKKFHDLHIPVMGPLDEIPAEEYQDRLNYLYYSTQHPYNNITYREYKSDSDLRLIKDKSSLIEGDKSKFNQTLDRWYPNMSINQINYRDCTNFESGPLSCNQPNPGLNDNILNNKDIEKFESIISKPKNLQKIYKEPIIFQNTDDITTHCLDQNNESPCDISNSLCSNCKVGTCWKGICGSDVFEEGKFIRSK